MARHAQKIPKSTTHLSSDTHTREIIRAIADREQRTQATQLSIIVNEWARANGFAKLVRS